MYKTILTGAWYAYVIVMCVITAFSGQITSIEEAFMFLFVTSVLLVLPEVFNNE